MVKYNLLLKINDSARGNQELFLQNVNDESVPEIGHILDFTQSSVSDYLIKLHQKKKSSNSSLFIFGKYKVESVEHWYSASRKGLEAISKVIASEIKK